MDRWGLFLHMVREALWIDSAMLFGLKGIKISISKHECSSATAKDNSWMRGKNLQLCLMSYKVFQNPWYRIGRRLKNGITQIFVSTCYVYIIKDNRLSDYWRESLYWILTIEYYESLNNWDKKGRTYPKENRCVFAKNMVWLYCIFVLEECKYSVYICWHFPGIKMLQHHDGIEMAVPHLRRTVSAVF